MRFSRIKYLSILAVLLMSIAMLPASFVRAQTSTDDLKAQREQLRQQLVGQAGQLLGAYNIDVSELNGLLPFIAKNDTAGLNDKLASLGLDETQSAELLKQAAPLIEQGMSSGVIQEFLAGEALKQVQDAGIAPQDSGDVVKAMGNCSCAPTDLQTALSNAGLDTQAVLGFVQRAEELRQMGLGADDFDRYYRVDALMTAMGESNFTPDNWNSLIDAYFSNPQVFDDALTAAGIEPQGFVDSFLEAYGQVYADNGFSEEDAGAFQQQAFADEVAGVMDDPEALAALLTEYGLSPEDTQAFVDASGDPEAIGALMEAQGIPAEDFQNAVENEQAMAENSGDNSDDNGSEASDNSGSEGSDNNGDSKDNTGSESGDTSNDNKSDSSGG